VCHSTGDIHIHICCCLRSCVCPPHHAHTQDARNRGIDRLVLLTTRTADWFMQRDFKLAGPAWSSELLPPSRRAQVNPARNSQLYYKNLDPLSDEERTEPGTRIGF
jgi:amino-acid N-acetyltransferase